MKTIKLLALGIFIFISSSMDAQVSVNLNVGSRPAWIGPSSNYSAVDFYYLPEIESYYDTRASLFVYPGKNGWVRSRSLPHQYRGYNLSKCNKVALKGYRGNRPYEHFNNHRKQTNKYKKFDNHHDNGHHKGHKGKH